VSQELVGRVSQLDEILAKRMLGIRLHVLDEQLAVALDDVERRSQVVANSAVKLLELLSLPAGRGAVRGHALHECGELDARAAHAIEIRQQMVELETARILDDDVEKIGDGSRRRLHLLAQIGGQGAMKALI